VLELDFERLIAERSYDADDFLQILLEPDAEGVIGTAEGLYRARV
jgi:hypothetical protein